MNIIKLIVSLTFLLVLICSCQDIKKSDSTTPYTIVYSSEESGDIELYLTDKEGKSKVKITNHPGRDGYSAWSPDGKRIACYAYHDERKTWSIHTMNSNGSNRKRLTHAKNKWDSAPAWSSDGSKIAFARDYEDTKGVWQEEIWIMNADGSEQTQIKPLTGGGPNFTQDGRIIFHSKIKSSYEICIANTDGSNFIQLTDNDARELYPEVSPNGKKIAFMSDRDGNFEIYTMNIDGSNPKRLTFNNVKDNEPSWSPDGSQLIFHSTNDDDEKHVYIMNKDGSSLEQLINNAWSAAWLKVSR